MDEALNKKDESWQHEEISVVFMRINRVVSAKKHSDLFKKQHNITLPFKIRVDRHVRKFGLAFINMDRQVGELSLIGSGSSA